MWIFMLGNVQETELDFCHCKQMIFHNRLNKTSTYLSQIIAKLKYLDDIERSISLKNGRLRFYF